jgi:predicted nucleic acid-binding protein
VVVAGILEGSLFYDVAQDFRQALAENDCTVVFSQLLRVELLQAVRQTGTVDGALPGKIRRAHRLQRWGLEIDVRRRWLQHGIDEFDALLPEFREVVEIPITRATWIRSAELMARFQIDSDDALHAATAIQYGAADFATLDADFSRVSELTTWLLR